MPANPRRLELLRRLEHLREVEKREAARRVADAQDTQGKLFALGERSGEIAALYGDRKDAMTGAELSRLLGFISGLGRIRSETDSEHRRAEAMSEEALTQLHHATRKRDITTDRLNAERRTSERALQAREAGLIPNLARKLKS